MNHIDLTIGALEIWSAIFTGTLLVGSLFGRQYAERRDKLLLSLMLVNVAMMFVDASIWFLLSAPRPDKVGLLKLLALIVDALSFVTAALYAYYLTASIAQRRAVSMCYAHVMAALSLLGALACLLSNLGTAYLWFDETGAMHHGALYPYFILYSVLLLMMETLYPLRYAKTLGTANALTLSSYGMLVLLASPFQLQLEAAPILLANTMTLMLIYAVTHGELGRRVTEQKEQLLKAQLEAEQARISVMLSQIQPHFMFNVLNTIYHLCDEDASRAQQAIGDFSEYLRGNIASLRRSGPVSFDVEMNNVRSYLALEKMRFEEELNIVYDIRTTAFMLPLLSVQPLAENAVKHGLCKKPGGGTLTISSRETERGFEVAVNDDGMGFDPDAPLKDDGRDHIGISATRQRLHVLCGGTLTIESRPGEGTTATIYIPKETPEGDK